MRYVLSGGAARAVRLAPRPGLTPHPSSPVQDVLAAAGKAPAAAAPPKAAPAAAAAARALPELPDGPVKLTGMQVAPPRAAT